MEESAKQVWTRRNSLIPTSEAFQLLLDQSHCQHWEIRIFLGAACAVVGRISSVDIPLISSVPLAIIIAFLPRFCRAALIAQMTFDAASHAIGTKVRVFGEDLVTSMCAICNCAILSIGHLEHFKLTTF